MTAIAIVEGDGIGHEVIPVARRVLELLKARIQKDPNDMIARRIYMQAATMIESSFFSLIVSMIICWPGSEHM